MSAGRIAHTFIANATAKRIRLMLLAALVVAVLAACADVPALLRCHT